MVTVSRIVPGDGHRYGNHLIASEAHRHQAVSDAKRPRVVVPPLSFAGLKVAGKGAADEDAPSQMAALPTAWVTPRESQSARAKIDANSVTAITLRPYPPSAPPAATTAAVAAVAVDVGAFRAASSEASSEDLSTTATPHASARRPNVPPLSLAGVRESLQGCSSVGARPPEELAQLQSGDRNSNAPEERLSGRAPSSASSATTEHDDLHHKDVVSQGVAVPADYAKRRAQVPKLSLHTLRKSPRGLRHSPPGLRHSPRPPEDTIPEEVGHGSSSSTSVLQDAAAASCHQGNNHEDSSIVETPRQRSARQRMAVPRLHLSACRPTMHGCYSLGVTPPEEVLSSRRTSPSKRHTTSALRSAVALKAEMRANHNVSKHSSRTQTLVNTEESSSGSCSDSPLGGQYSDRCTGSTPAVSARTARGGDTQRSDRGPSDSQMGEAHAAEPANASAIIGQEGTGSLGAEDGPLCSKPEAETWARLWLSSMTLRLPEVNRCFEFLLRPASRAEVPA